MATSGRRSARRSSPPTSCVFSTPTWVGHLSSVAARVIERLDAELSETDDEGRPILAGKVAVTVVVGNEDGAHKITADLYQALGDVGLQHPVRRAARTGTARRCTPSTTRICDETPGGDGERDRDARAERRAPREAAAGQPLPGALTPRIGGAARRARRV